MTILSTGLHKSVKFTEILTSAFPSFSKVKGLGSPSVVLSLSVTFTFPRLMASVGRLMVTTEVIDRFLGVAQLE